MVTIQSHEAGRIVIENSQDIISGAGNAHPTHGRVDRSDSMKEMPIGGGGPGSPRQNEGKG
jgi:hypothetical protein